MSESFWSLRLPDIINALILTVTVWAIVYGPIRAVSISRKQDLERDSQQRKRIILSALMRTRKITMHPDHVGALNQIQLEFFASRDVIDAYRAYITNLSETVPPPGNALDNFMTRRNDLFFDLLHKISEATEVMMDRHDLDRLAYVPFGWQTEQDEIRALRASAVQILKGSRPLWVTDKAPPQLATTPHNPFPPPPP